MDFPASLHYLRQMVSPRNSFWISSLHHCCLLLPPAAPFLLTGWRRLLPSAVHSSRHRLPRTRRFCLSCTPALSRTICACWFWTDYRRACLSPWVCRRTAGRACCDYAFRAVCTASVHLHRRVHLYAPCRLLEISACCCLCADARRCAPVRTCCRLNSFHAVSAHLVWITWTTATVAWVLPTLLPFCSHTSLPPYLLLPALLPAACTARVPAPACLPRACPPPAAPRTRLFWVGGLHAAHLDGGCHCLYSSAWVSFDMGFLILMGADASLSRSTDSPLLLHLPAYLLTCTACYCHLLPQVYYCLHRSVLDFFSAFRLPDL